MQDDLLETLCILGLLLKAGPQFQWCARKQKHIKWARFHARLTANPSWPALLFIRLSIVAS